MKQLFLLPIVVGLMAFVPYDETDFTVKTCNILRSDTGSAIVQGFNAAGRFIIDFGESTRTWFYTEERLQEGYKSLKERGICPKE